MKTEISKYKIQTSGSGWWKSPPPLHTYEYSYIMVALTSENWNTVVVTVSSTSDMLEEKEPRFNK